MRNDAGWYKTMALRNLEITDSEQQGPRSVKSHGRLDHLVGT